MKIEPTVGRSVWYWPVRVEHPWPTLDQPWAAIITHVWTDTIVNLTVFPPAGGSPISKTSILLWQDDGTTARPAVGESAFAEWMPYQKGQAQKAAAAPQAPA